MKSPITILCLCLCLTPLLHAQVPHSLHCQKRISVGRVNSNGTGQFRLALVNDVAPVTRL